MLASFIRYFFHYIFFSKTRQKLLYLAFIGLFLSAFALLVLQSSMKGLQTSQIERSKAVTGHAVIELNNQHEEFAGEVSAFLSNKGVKHSSEYNIELLVRNDDHITPMVVHGIDTKVYVPDFLRTSSLEELVIPYDIAAKLQVELGSKVQLISPSHVDSFFGDIPRSVTLFVEDFISTKVPEIDIYHGWLKLSTIQNLINEKSINRLVIYQEINFNLLKEQLQQKFGDQLYLQNWEMRNENLVWALKLESVVMLFLFISMTLLVSLCITLGLLIFFNKIKRDLSSFWILGASKGKLESSSWLFLNFMSVTAVSAGIVCSLLFLFLFKHYGGEIMPENFVDRKIPVVVTWQGILISFFVPYLISLIFSWASLRQFKKDTDFLDQVRAIG